MVRWVGFGVAGVRKVVTGCVVRGFVVVLGVVVVVVAEAASSAYPTPISKASTASGTSS